MTKDILYYVYASYLFEVANKEQRGCKPPNSLKTLYDRNDKQFFFVLEKLLLKDNISTIIEVRNFMSIAFNKLPDFNMIFVVKEYEQILQQYREFVSSNSVEEKVKRIKKTFDNIEEYCIINNINNWEQLSEGNPPLILKLWKEEKIYELVLVKIFDFDLVKKKTWYKVYCNKINRKIKTLKKELETNVTLSSVMEAELQKINTYFNKQGNKNG